MRRFHRCVPTGTEQSIWRKKGKRSKRKKKRTTGELREIVKSSSKIWIQLPEFDPYKELNHCIGMYKAAV